MAPPERSAHAERKAQYHAWLVTQQLRFGFAEELADMADHVDDGITNDTPPRDMWPRIIPTIREVECVREVFGPTTLTSAYRSRLYNSVVADSTDSRHSHNDAIDFKCAKGKPDDWYAFLRARRDAGLFRGGLASYRSFVHVDTRGRNANWRGKRT